MKITTIAKLSAGLLVLCVPAVAWGQGIRNSEHDLSATSISTLKNATNNQICIYCHTPHRAQSTQFLWNHTATQATTWQWGNDLDGNPLTATSYGTPLPLTLKSGSKRCLGCHDGSVAIGDVSNAGGGAPGVISGLSGIAGMTDASGRLIDLTHMVGNTVTGGVGNMGGNHPISIPYAGMTGYNSITSGVPATMLGGAVGGYYNATAVGCTSSTGICTAAPATDGRNGAAIALYPNASGGSTSANLGIECGSCHEPHNQFGFPFFGRVDVSNASGLCRSCHNK